MLMTFVASGRLLVALSMAANLVNVGSVLKGQYEVTQMFGESNTGMVFEVKDKKRNCNLALKVESKKPEGDDLGLELEIRILQRLQSSRHIPRYIDEGKLGICRYMITQLVGRNLVDLRTCCLNYKFTMSTAVRVASQCLEAIRDVHEIGFVHRNIQPANFAIGRTPGDCRIIYLLDFSIVRRFRLADGTIVPARPVAGFRGAVRYASPNAHKKRDLGPHDDIWSWLYMFVEMIKGELGWRLEDDKDKVGKMKSAPRALILLNMDNAFHYIFQDLIKQKYDSIPKYEWLFTWLQKLKNTYRIGDNNVYDWEEGGVAFENAKNVNQQPYQKQMRATKQVVNERLAEEEEEEQSM